jgi:hypothetical protein
VARENLIRGASQNKLALRVDVSSNFDPVDVAEYTKGRDQNRRRRREEL